MNFGINRPSAIAACIALLATMSAALGHHASAPHFDSNRPIEIEGVVTKFEFVNPHAYLYLDVTDANGNETNWNCEMSAASPLSRRGWTEDLFRPGMAVSIEGNAARRDPHGCAFQAGILADGTVIARSGEITRGNGTSSAVAAATAAGAIAGGDSDSLAGTWITTPRTRGGGGGPPGMARFEGLLTDAGIAAAARYDERFDDPALDCSPSSLIRVWSEPNGISEITQTAQSITIKHEFMDTVRTVDLSTRDHPSNIERSLTGHSVGWFEDDTLVVETVGFAAGVLLPHPGIMHTEDMRLVERIHLTEDGTQLIREYEVTDPEYLTGPYRGTNRWNRTELSLPAYNCTELSGINNIRPDGE